MAPAYNEFGDGCKARTANVGWLLAPARFSSPAVLAFPPPRLQVSPAGRDGARPRSSAMQGGRPPDGSPSLFSVSSAELTTQAYNGLAAEAKRVRPVLERRHMPTEYRCAFFRRANLELERPAGDQELLGWPRTTTQCA